MKQQYIFLVICTALLLGCNSTSTSQNQVSETANQNQFERLSNRGIAKNYFATSVGTANSSLTEVLQRLQLFADSCVDGKTIRKIQYIRGFPSTVDTKYKAEISIENGIHRLLVLTDVNSGAVIIGGQKGFRVSFSAQLQSQSDTTIIRSRHYKGDRALHDAIVSWADGRQQNCLDLSTVTHGGIG